MALLRFIGCGPAPLSNARAAACARRKGRQKRRFSGVGFCILIAPVYQAADASEVEEQKSGSRQETHQEDKLYETYNLHFKPQAIFRTSSV